MESPLLFRVVRAKKGPELDMTFIEAPTEIQTGAYSSTPL